MAAVALLSCFLQGFTQVYVGDERSYKLGKLGPGQRFSFKIRVSSSTGRAGSSNTFGVSGWQWAACG
jgi:hypothetical protein